MSDKLDEAYALTGTEACKTLYAGWADSYDTSFAKERGYRLPAVVAAEFIAHRVPNNGPILDVGAGTGLVADALHAGGYQGPIDGVDLSPDMLAQAARKGRYRSLITADVTQPLPPGTRYHAFVSAGTFTHGHVAPEGLLALAQSAEPGALFVISINEAIWETAGFSALLTADGRFTDLATTRTPIYSETARGIDPAHAHDTALIARFRAR